MGEDRLSLVHCFLGAVHVGKLPAGPPRATSAGDGGGEFGMELRDRPPRTPGCAADRLALRIWFSRWRRVCLKLGELMIRHRPIPYRPAMYILRCAARRRSVTRCACTYLSSAKTDCAAGSACTLHG